MRKMKVFKYNDFRFKGVFADFNFLSKTVQTVIDTITDMAGAECPASIR